MEQKNQERQSLDVLGFLKYLFQKKRILVIVALAALILSTVYVFLIATPIYEATSQIYMVNSQDSVINLSDLQIGSYLTSDYQWMFQTWEVNQTVINNLKLPYSVKQMKDKLTVKNPSNTRVLTITFASKNAKEAALVANEYATVVSQYISDAMLTSKPTTISVALEPLAPARPRKLLVIGITTALACVAAAWILFIVYLYDDKVKDASDLRKYMNADPLTVIPYSEKNRKSRNKI